MNPQTSSETRDNPTCEIALAQLGESRVLRTFMPILQAHNERAAAESSRAGHPIVLEVGPGDDCAVLAPTAERIVVTTDTLVQDQDFMNLWPGGIARATEDGDPVLEPARSSGYDVGRKAATQNLADVAAMGARPASLFISLSLPGCTPYGWVEGFARGIVDGVNSCGATECVIGGGDIGDSTEMSVTVTALGYTDLAILRSEARPPARALRLPGGAHRLVRCRPAFATQPALTTRHGTTARYCLRSECGSRTGIRGSGLGEETS